MAECARLHELDMLCLAECQGVTFVKLNEALGELYRPINPNCLNNKVRLFAKDTVSLKSRIFEADRIITCAVECESVTYSIAATHLPDKRSDPDGDSRMEYLRDLVVQLRDVENNASCERSIVIGDFNADPFEREMTDPDTLFSTIYKDVIKRCSVRTRNRKQRRVMFNPVLMTLPAGQDCHGSYYFDKIRAPLYWHFYDQIVVSKQLIDSIAHCAYLHSIGDESLLEKGRPKKEISDHLPLFVKLEGESHE